MTALRLWFLVTAAILLVLGVWAFAPPLIFLLLLTLGLGLVSFAMVGLAQAIRAWRERGGP